MIYLIYVLVALGLDQLSKLLIIQNVAEQDQIAIIPGWFYITHWHNSGGAFGILQGQGVWLAWVAVIVSICIVGLLVFFPRPLRLVNFGFALIAGGALGNLADRLRLDYVVDFIQVCVNDVCAFPVFNIADSVIVVGTGLILFAWLRHKDPEPIESDTPSEEFSKEPKAPKSEVNPVED